MLKFFIFKCWKSVYFLKITFEPNKKMCRPDVMWRLPFAIFDQKSLSVTNTQPCNYTLKVLKSFFCVQQQGHNFTLPQVGLTLVSLFGLSLRRAS